MQSDRQRLNVDAPAAYRIEIQGRLGEGWSSWFDGMAITVESGDNGEIITVLNGTVVDQVALYGVLARIRDLGLPLLLVQRMSEISRKA
jgi:hypothetical protein